MPYRFVFENKPIKIWFVSSILSLSKTSTPQFISIVTILNSNVDCQDRLNSTPLGAKQGDRGQQTELKSILT